MRKNTDAGFRNVSYGKRLKGILFLFLLVCCMLGCTQTVHAEKKPKQLIDFSEKMEKEQASNVLLDLFYHRMGKNALARAYDACGEISGSDGKYVVLGDSIAAGYRLEGYKEGVLPKDAYAAKVGKEINQEPVNRAVVGITSEELFLKLQKGEYDEDLKDAGLVTLSVGSNDLLKPFMGLLKEAFKEDIRDDMEMDVLKAFEEKYNPMTKEGREALQKKWNEIRDAIAEDPVVQAALRDFKERFPKIIDSIHKKAPGARIVATSLYNPYVTFNVRIPGFIDFDLGTVCEQYIKEMNEVFSGEDKDFETADVYPVFDRYLCSISNLNIMDISAFSFDPHPNVYGHFVMSEIILDTLDKDRPFQKVDVKKEMTIKEGKNKKLRIRIPEYEEGEWNPYETMKTEYSVKKTSVARITKKGMVEAVGTGKTIIRTKLILNGQEKEYRTKVVVK